VDPPGRPRRRVLAREGAAVQHLREKLHALLGDDLGQRAEDGAGGEDGEPMRTRRRAARRADRLGDAAREVLAAAQLLGDPAQRHPEGVEQLRLRPWRRREGRPALVGLLRVERDPHRHPAPRRGPGGAGHRVAGGSRQADVVEREVEPGARGVQEGDELVRDLLGGLAAVGERADGDGPGHAAGDLR
jgi:hypothetical protein